MDRFQQEVINVDDNVGNRKDFNSYALKILHHNVQIVSNNLLELSILLSLYYINVDILCFTEHWLMEEQIKLLNIDQLKLVSNFSRFSSNYGGSCIFVQKDLHTKEVNYLKGIGSDKVFELSVVELLDFNFTLACVYIYIGHLMEIFMNV
jgi:hypothetical protein